MNRVVCLISRVARAGLVSEGGLSGSSITELGVRVRGIVCNSWYH
jgi:hypothetical protein